MARGRMLNRTVCASLKFQQMPDDTCRLLATWIIPHLDLNGVFYADPPMVKSAVFPRRSDITDEQVASYLDAIEELGLIYRFEARGDVWQCWPGFAENQVGLRRDRETTTYPLPPGLPAETVSEQPETIRQDDGNDPENIPHKASKENLREVEGKETEPNPSVVATSHTDTPAPPPVAPDAGGGGSSMTVTDVDRNFQSEIRLQFTRGVYEELFHPLRVEDVDDSAITFSVPVSLYDDIARTCQKDPIASIVCRTLSGIVEHPVTVSYTARDDAPAKTRPKEPAPTFAVSEQSRATMARWADD